MLPVIPAKSDYRGLNIVWQRGDADASLNIRAPKGRYVTVGNLVLALDVRLDNRTKLLQELGLSSDDDAALLAAAWKRWGRDCPARLEGDFAFVIWDAEAVQLFAARDVMGARPLFYRQQGSLLGLAGYARDLSGRDGFGAGLSRDAAEAWAHKGYDDKYAMFDKVFFLPPGGFLLAGPDRLELGRYWDFDRVKPLRYKDIRDYAAHFRDLLGRCVSDRCRDSKGPVGITLSGGMDSTTVAAAAVRAGIPLQPYSFRFPDFPDCDESAGSAAVAQKLGLPEPVWVDCRRFWLFQGAFEGMPLQDDPFQSWDNMDRWIMGDLVEKGGNVLLTGHGGDSLFTGLSDGVILGARISRGQLNHAPAFRQFLAGKSLSMFQGLYHYLVAPRIPLSIRNRIKLWLGRDIGLYPWMDLPKKHYVSLITRLSSAPRLFNDIARQALYEEVAHHSFSIRRMMHWHHRLAAPFGVSSRHPLFDRRLAEFVLAVPPEILREGGYPKGFLRFVMRDYLPPLITENPNKPSLFSFYHYGFQQERDKLNVLIRQSPLADMGIVDRVRLQKEVDHYLVSDPKTALAYFGPAVMTDLWLRRELS